MSKLSLKSDYFLAFFLSCILILGVVLRLNEYSTVPPVGETRDEFQYPWAGLTLLQTGVPSSWSYFDAYQNRQSTKVWGQEFRIVTPWFDKPLLYPLLTGIWMWVLGARNFADITMAQLRLIPLLLSSLTIILVGLIGKKLISDRVGMLAALLYAVTPTIVLANRLSLTENLLIPLVLGALLILNQSKQTRVSLIVLGVLTGLAFLTKQIGFTLYLAVLWPLVLQKKWKDIAIVSSIFATFVGIHFGVVAFYGLKLYLAVMSDFRIAHTLVGLPELVFAIFQNPVIGQKGRVFLDGTILLGTVLLFTSPWTMGKLLKNAAQKLFLLLGFPLFYLTALVLVESGATEFSYFGWHIYPLYPFLMLLVAWVIEQVLMRPELFTKLLLFLFLGASSIRFVFLLNPPTWTTWQEVLSLLALALVAAEFVNLRVQKTFLFILLVVFVGISIYTSWQVGLIYPTQPPL